MRRSRLSKKSERNNLKTIILSFVGIILVIYLLLKFGLAILVNFSLFFSSGKNQNTLNQNEISFIPAPILNPSPVATNSAKINISGKSIKNYTINLYLNNQSIDQAQVDDKGNFSFTETLDVGNNQIKVNAQNNSKKSDFSNILNIAFINAQPNLVINTPSDGQTFKKDQNTVNVTGVVDPGASVTVNGYWAVIDENNNFSYVMTLKDGDNQIKIVETDQAGNQTEKDLKVNYSQ